MYDLTPFVGRELTEHHELIAVLTDRVEILERIDALTRQLDALTYRALRVCPDLTLEAMEEIGTAAGSTATAAAEPAEPKAEPKPAPAKRTTAKRTTAKKKAAKRTTAKQRKATPQPGPVVPKRAQRKPAVEIGTVQDEVLKFLGARDLTDPASPIQIAEGIGRDRYQVDKAIAKCNGQLAKVVEGRGPNPSFYVRADMLPAESWPHTANESRAQSVPEWLNELEERAGTVKRRGEGLRDTGPLIAEADVGEPAAAPAAPAMSARTRRALEEEAAHAEANGDPGPAKELTLSDRVLAVLRGDGGQRVRAVAEQLGEDPALVARAVNDHLKNGNVRKSPDGTFYAATALETVL